MSSRCVPLLGFADLSTIAAAMPPAQQAPKPVLIRASRLLDVRAGAYR
jgi:hypothetical protein